MAIKAANRARMSPLSLRTSPELRAQLEEACRASGQSLTHEVEARLKASFDQPALIDALAERLEARRAAIVPSVEFVKSALAAGQRVPSAWVDHHAVAALDKLSQGMKTLISEDEIAL